MSKKFNDLKVGLDEDLEEKLAWMAPNFDSYHILKKSVDARRKNDPHFVYSVEVFENGEEIPQPDFNFEQVANPNVKPIIVGSGPAGLFAALRLVERGVPCTLLERGSDCGQRMKAIARFWRYGEFNSNNNIGFGEGGAGLYSDGKLITRIKSPHIPYVMHKLVEFGAPDEIKYLANPHVGSDKIRRVIPKIREYLLSKGCEIHFNSQVTDIEFDDSKQVTAVLAKNTNGLATENNSQNKLKKFETNAVILATGHSANDIFELLHKKEVFMEKKPFAVGLRVEHSQKSINKIQFRDFADHPKLGAANYKLTYNKDGVGVYSFCMCPGGYVLSSGTEAKGLVSNGMSNYNRNSPFANSAVVVTYEMNENDPLFRGIGFRRELEEQAYRMVQEAGGTKELPAQSIPDFFSSQLTEIKEKTSCPSGAISARLDQLLPKDLHSPFHSALESFENKMPGFSNEDALLFGVESRTSCPLRITRDKESLQSLSHSGLYPTGEGAGYAGGITSAACDGIRVAEACIDSLVK